MFVVVTVFAVWLGWELKFIRDRRAFLAAMDDLRTTEIQNSKLPILSSAYVTGIILDAPIPFWRRWLGDEPQTMIILPRTSSASDRETAERLFPEAEVHRSD
jgi:hypothetical protein